MIQKTPLTNSNSCNFIDFMCTIFRWTKFLKKSIWFYKFSPKNSEQVISRPSKQKSSRERKTIISLTTVSRKKLMKKKLKHVHIIHIFAYVLITTQTISMGNIKYMVLSFYNTSLFKKKIFIFKRAKNNHLTNLSSTCVRWQFCLTVQYVCHRFKTRTSKTVCHKNCINHEKGKIVMVTTD